MLKSGADKKKRSIAATSATNSSKGATAAAGGSIRSDPGQQPPPMARKRGRPFKSPAVVDEADDAESQAAAAPSSLSAGDDSDYPFLSQDVSVKIQSQRPKRVVARKTQTFSSAKSPTPKQTPPPATQPAPVPAPAPTQKTKVKGNSKKTAPLAPPPTQEGQEKGEEEENEESSAPTTQTTLSTPKKKKKSKKNKNLPHPAELRPDELHLLNATTMDPESLDDTWEFHELSSRVTSYVFLNKEVANVQDYAQSLMGNPFFARILTEPPLDSSAVNATLFVRCQLAYEAILIEYIDRCGRPEYADLQANKFGVVKALASLHYMLTRSGWSVNPPIAYADIRVELHTQEFMAVCRNTGEIPDPEYYFTPFRLHIPSGTQLLDPVDQYYIDSLATRYKYITKLVEEEKGMETLEKNFPWRPIQEKLKVYFGPAARKVLFRRNEDDDPLGTVDVTNLPFKDEESSEDHQEKEQEQEEDVEEEDDDDQEERGTGQSGTQATTSSGSQRRLVNNPVFTRDVEHVDEVDDDTARDLGIAFGKLEKKFDGDGKKPARYLDRQKDATKVSFEDSPEPSRNKGKQRVQEPVPDVEMDEQEEEDEEEEEELERNRKAARISQQHTQASSSSSLSFAQSKIHRKVHPPAASSSSSSSQVPPGYVQKNASPNRGLQTHGRTEPPRQQQRPSAPLTPQKVEMWGTQGFTLEEARARTPEFKFPRQRIFWTEDELDALEEGMMKYGASWQKIEKECGALGNKRLERRNQIQLKDKARVEKAKRVREGLPLGAFAVAGKPSQRYYYN